MKRMQEEEWVARNFVIAGFQLKTKEIMKKL